LADRGTGAEAARGEELSRLQRGLESLAGSTSRRGFLARLSGALAAGTAGGLVAKAVRPGEADAYHFCGHIFTTGSCPHPAGRALPRIDGKGFALHPDGTPVDNIGRRVNGKGQPIAKNGNVKRDADGRALPPAPRTQLCQDQVSRRFHFRTWVDGGWYRCCGGKVRKLVDCCSNSKKRINGDEALEGYCYRGRKVFCVMYFQTKVPC
jgi:hypothetical protein